MTSMKRVILETDTCRRLLSRMGKSPTGKNVLMQLARHHGVYEDFESAWADAARKQTYAGHDHSEAIQNHINLGESLRPSDYAVLFWMSQIGTKLRIFDFGGNIGNLYYSYLPYIQLGEESGLESWTSYDLPTINDQGRALALERQAQKLSFVESLDTVTSADILLASGSLHYWEQSIGSLFERFSGMPEHVLINRSPFHETEPTFVTLQSYTSFAVPCIVRNSGELIQAMRALGYALVNRWKAIELSINLTLFPDKSIPFYQGFYFRRERRSPARMETSEQASGIDLPASDLAA